MTTHSEIFKALNYQINALERSNKVLKTLFLLFVFITLLLAAFIVYIELETPPFGKWRTINEGMKQTEQYNDYLLSRIDSIGRANDLLMENSPYYKGIFFEVQIGAFKNFDLGTYQQSLENIRYYRQDSLNKYVLGKFRDYNMARAFQKDITRMGIADAFIVGKIDGNRVEIREALKAAR